jgi:hypothetical protein
VNLPLYKRNKEEWKNRQARGQGGTPAELHAQARAMPPQRQSRTWQAAESRPAAQAVSEESTGDTSSSKKRRKARTEEADEIDQIFGGASKRGRVEA